MNVRKRNERAVGQGNNVQYIEGPLFDLASDVGALNVNKK